eukprot:364681-Chlamydomonas_euryale.AAC.15
MCPIAAGAPTCSVLQQPAVQGLHNYAANPSSGAGGRLGHSEHVPQIQTDPQVSLVISDAAA